jgi:hypothetical protein
VWWNAGIHKKETPGAHDHHIINLVEIW